MMMEGAFSQPKRTNPTALAIVLLMHGAGITALALAKGEVIRDKFPIVDVFNVKPDEPPPPEPVKPVEKAAVPKTVVTHVPPEVQLPPRPDFIDTPPLPPVERIVIQEPPAVPAPRIDIAPAAEPVRTVRPARARANLASYVSDEDYPNSAIRDLEQGTTRFRLGIGPDGRVSECTVIASSGSSSLDSATCRLMKQRARFVPARDSHDKATTDSVTSAIRWVLPD